MGGEGIEPEGVAVDDSGVSRAAALREAAGYWDSQPCTAQFPH